jgi:site-specific DNA-methyltransferase (adenine-specific)
MDTMTQQEYINWTISLFNEFNDILAENGVILWNMSYGSDGTVNKEGVGLVWLVIADIIRNTNFMVADRIVWKKRNALPNNVSKNKLTRITEDVFVFCRKDEYKTFQCNKEVSQVAKTGQTFYKNIYNFIEAPNNDGPNKLNKATYSSDLCEQLLRIYGVEGSVVYDPFIGTGTTAVACKRLGLDCFGSEISKEQVEFSLERLK